ncbi:MAG: hypothetical protein JRN58_07030 [Nitrososphaerota archaeon]|nr:hypothetical protein [Nitrososphaerota archaeon]
MVRALCARCHKQVGGLLRALWQCPECRKVFCEDCPTRWLGFWGFRKPACPDCSIEMREGGLPPAWRRWSP